MFIYIIIFILIIILFLFILYKLKKNKENDNESNEDESDNNQIEEIKEENIGEPSEEITEEEEQQIKEEENNIDYIKCDEEDCLKKNLTKEFVHGTPYLPDGINNKNFLTLNLFIENHPAKYLFVDFEKSGFRVSLYNKTINERNEKRFSGTISSSNKFIVFPNDVFTYSLYKNPLSPFTEDDITKLKNNIKIELLDELIINEKIFENGTMHTGSWYNTGEPIKKRFIQGFLLKTPKDKDLQIKSKNPDIVLSYALYNLDRKTEKTSETKLENEWIIPKNSYYGLSVATKELTPIITNDFLKNTILPALEYLEFYE